MIAMLADIDPRLLSVEISSSERSLQDDVFETARWMGKLYRERRAAMNLRQAQRLDRLINDQAVPDEDRLELRYCVDTMLSFLGRRGLGQLMEGVAAVCHDRLIRSVIVTDAIGKTAEARGQTDEAHAHGVLATLRAKVAEAAKAAEARAVDARARVVEATAEGAEASRRAMKDAEEAEAEAASYNIVLPPPIFVSGGYVLVPGDYERAWRRRWLDLLCALEPK